MLSFKGARHTYAQMAGRNVANPTAMLLSGADMLDHIKYVYLIEIVECIDCLPFRGKGRIEDEF